MCTTFRLQSKQEKKLERGKTDMREVLIVEKETCSISLRLERIYPRDFDASEEFMHDIADLVHAYCMFLDRDSVSEEEEQSFLLEFERVADGLAGYAKRLRALSTPVGRT
jgi:hypothetical protein